MAPISRRSRNRHVSAVPPRCRLRASLRIRAPCTSQASSLASTSCLDTAELSKSSERQPQHGVRALRVALLALEVPQHHKYSTFAHISSSVMHPFSMSTASFPSRLQHLWGHAAHGMSTSGHGREGRGGWHTCSRRCAQSLAASNRPACSSATRKQLHIGPSAVCWAF